MYLHAIFDTKADASGSYFGAEGSFAYDVKGARSWNSGNAIRLGGYSASSMSLSSSWQRASIGAASYRASRLKRLM